MSSTTHSRPPRNRPDSKNSPSRSSLRKRCNKRDLRFENTPVHPPKTVDCEPLKRLVREVPDFPKPGILFYDITTLLKDGPGLRTLIDALAERFAAERIDLVLGIEARGFIFGPALAYRLGAGFVPVRKPRKLPAKTTRVSYALEYGTDALELHVDAIREGQRVLVVDDLLATGGTAAACIQLARSLGGEVRGAAFVIELADLQGRAKLQGVEVFSLLRYPG